MSENLDNNGLKSIADNYDIFYIDLWGVIHNGINLHKNALEVLEEITKVNKKYVLLTNAPRPNKTVKSFLEKMGMKEEMREKVYTSGEAALGYLKKNLLDKKFYHLGPPRDFDLFSEFKNNKTEDIIALGARVYYKDLREYILIDRTHKSLIGHSDHGNRKFFSRQFPNKTPHELKWGY